MDKTEFIKLQDLEIPEQDNPDDILAEAKNQQANAKQSAQAVDDDFLSNLGF